MAPYLVTVRDPFWEAVATYEPVGKSIDASRFLFRGAETPLENTNPIAPSTIVHLRIEHGDIPFSEIAQRYPLLPSHRLVEWVNDVLSVATYHEILEPKNLLKAVLLSRELHVPRNPMMDTNLDHAILHWSVDTHTFVWVWGKEAPPWRIRSSSPDYPYTGTGHSLSPIYLPKCVLMLRPSQGPTRWHNSGHVSRTRASGRPLRMPKRCPGAAGSGTSTRISNR